MDILGSDFPYSSTALAGKHAFVCGASKGIGAATAQLLARCGANVTVAARDEAALEALVNTMTELGQGTLAWFHWILKMKTKLGNGTSSSRE